MTVANRRAAVTRGVEAGWSERRACCFVGLERKTFRIDRDGLNGTSFELGSALLPRNGCDGGTDVFMCCFGEKGSRRTTRWCIDSIVKRA